MENEINAGPEMGMVDSLASLWSESGKHVEPPLNKWACAIDGCGTMAFVVLRTKDGTKAVCFKHFDEIQSVVGPDQAQTRNRAALAAAAHH